MIRPFKVLVVEDEPKIRRDIVRRIGALSRLFETAGEARNGREGVALAAELEPDLIISDIVMPGLDGIGLALKVARDRPELPVLLMTGFAAERQRAHNLDELICEVVTKPFTLKEICDAAEDVMAVNKPPTRH